MKLLFVSSENEQLEDRLPDRESALAFVRGPFQ